MEYRKRHQAPFRLGQSVVDPRVRRIERDGISIRLEPKVMDVLLCLVERAGDTVTRSELEASVWPGAVIGEDTLNRAISKLRKALRNEPGAPSAIETVPKMGYRLALPISEAAVTESAMIGTSTARRWLVVLGVAAVAVAGAALAVRALDRESEPTTPVVSVLPLTSYPGYEFAPSISPDGRFVAFERYDKTRPGPHSWDVYVQAIDGDGVPRPLAATDADESAPAWSPDGDSVAFVVRSSDDCAIVLQSALGGATEQLVACDPMASYRFDWQPDGSALIVARAGADPGLFRLDRSSRSLTRLTAPSSEFLHDMHPRISPDGSKLAFVRTRAQGISDLYVLRTAQPSEVERLTHDNRRIAGLAWTPNGREILFTSNRGGNSHLWRVSAGGGEPVMIPMSGRNAGQLSMSATGVLAYAEYNGDDNIWEFAPGSSRAVQWSADTRSELSPRISPDGSRVAFVSNRTGSAEVWVSDRDGGRPLRLTHLQGAVLDPPRWSPDGRQLAYAAADDGHFDVYTVTVATARVDRITDDPGDERAPSWWSESTLVFASNTTGDWELWQRDLSTGRVTRLTTGGGFGSALGPGRRLYFTHPDRPGLFVLDSNRTVTMIWDEVQAGDWNNFTLSRDHVFYLRVSNTPAVRLRVFDLQTRDTRTIEIPATEAASLAGVSVGPDGSILYSQVDRSESDLWYIAGFKTR